MSKSLTTGRILSKVKDFEKIITDRSSLLLIHSVNKYFLTLLKPICPSYHRYSIKLIYNEA